MKIFNGGLSVDDRGTVMYANDFDFKDVKRFYMVQNHSKGFVRAWHGHKKEGKYVLVVKGAIQLFIIPMDDDSPEGFVLSALKPQVLFIPPRHYNGFKTLTDDAQVMFFSTTTMEESKDDDFRESATKWDLWGIEWR